MGGLLPSRKYLGASTVCGGGQGRQATNLSWRLHCRLVLDARDQCGGGDVMGGSCLGGGWAQDRADRASFLGSGCRQKDL